MIPKTEGRLSALLQNMHDPEKIMQKKDTAQSLLRKLPGIDHILELTQKNPHFEDRGAVYSSGNSRTAAIDPET